MAMLKVPLIRQSEVHECGLACMGMISSYFGFKCDMVYLRDICPPSARGLSVADLSLIASRLHIMLTPMKVEIENVKCLQFPAILHWDMSHFVILHGYSNGRYVISDPARGRLYVEEEELDQSYTGIAIEAAPVDTFKKADVRTKFGLSDIWPKNFRVPHYVVQTMIVSALVQVAVLGSPFFIQEMIDSRMRGGSENLLLVLVLCLGFLFLFEFASRHLRSMLVTRFLATLNFTMLSQIFAHLLKLPTSFFLNRNTGEIISRFYATRGVRNFLAQGIVTAVLDGLLVFASVVLMAIYSKSLLVVALIGGLVQVGVRLSWLDKLRGYHEATLANMAKEDSALIQAVNAIFSIKLFAKTDHVETVYKSKLSSSVNAMQQFEHFSGFIVNLGSLISGIATCAVAYLGLRQFEGGGMSLGMFVAFLAYFRLFGERLEGVLREFAYFSLIKIDLERISDITLTKASEMRLQKMEAQAGADTVVAFRELGFSYGKEKVLSEINLDIQRNENIAITGPSGSGKTTLLKILCGLLEPTSGDVFYRDPDELKIGVVSQNDKFLAGTIMENISFFDEGPDVERVRQCLRLAEILPEIDILPLGIYTDVGDHGAGFSGGQMQRLFLARALYRQPNILIMDEGTSHLDEALERKIILNIKRLNITRIQVAHRAETLRHADRVMHLEQGRVWKLEVNSEPNANFENVGEQNYVAWS